MRIKVWLHADKKSCYAAGVAAGLTVKRAEKFARRGSEHLVEYEVDVEGWATLLLIDGREIASEPTGREITNEPTMEPTAPELLAALEYAVRLYETYGLVASVENFDAESHNPGAWVNQARAAIAKARGEA